MSRSTDKPLLRIYLRRSRADEGHQQFSLDVQREGAHRFARDQLPARGFDVTWLDRVEYVDDDRAGDDFIGRAALHRLMKDSRRGDVVVCRDQSRIGRDALEVTLVIRDLVRDVGARLFYYADGQEIVIKNALDQAMTFVRGTGHQMELEAIRSRTREHLRSRVMAGRVAGGSCYGYKLERVIEPDRKYTLATIDEGQAEIVRRVYRMFLDGFGPRKIAVTLNDERIPSPRAGRRGTRSWCPNGIRAMLQNPRYRGLYVHGRVNRVRRGGKRICVDAAPEEILTVDIPAWRIIDDDTWAAVQEGFTTRAVGPRSQFGPASKYALTGIARCAKCGGPVSALHRQVGGGLKRRAYGCNWHNQRGDTVCSVKVRQPIEEVESVLAGFLADALLTEDVVDRVMEQIRDKVRQQLATATRDTADTERELAQARAEQRNLVTAVATGGDSIPELVAELRKRNDRIRMLEGDLAAAKRTPEAALALLAGAEAEITDQLRDMRRTLLTNPGDARELFLAMFPKGLTFSEDQQEGRPIWAIRGMAQLGPFLLKSDPDEI